MTIYGQVRLTPLLNYIVVGLDLRKQTQDSLSLDDLLTCIKNRVMLHSKFYCYDYVSNTFR